MRRQLWDAEFYKDQPTDLWPAPDVLSSQIPHRPLFGFAKDSGVLGPDLK